MMMQTILDTAFGVVLLYLSPAIFIIAAIAVSDKLIDLVKAATSSVRGRRRY